MPGLGLILDIVIIALLGATIFYAIRLSRHLDVFRSNRSDMERLIRELSMQITRAQEGVSSLDEAAKESGDELRGLVNKARTLSEELTLINEAGNSLAERLETLATRNRMIADELGSSALNMVVPGAGVSGRTKPSSPVLAAERRPSAPLVERRTSSSSLEEPSLQEEAPSRSPFFAIRDPDFSERTEAADDGDGTDDFSSQAERDLAAALRRRKPKDI